MTGAVTFITLLVKVLDGSSRPEESRHENTANDFRIAGAAAGEFG